MRLPKWVCLLVLAMGLVLVAGDAARAQVNTADLSGQVLDPQGLAVAGAKVTVKSLATGATRTAVADEAGRYRIVGLPPGRYELAAEGGKGLTKLVNPEIVLTIGQSAEFDAHLQLQTGVETVTVTEATELIETGRTAAAETVDRRQIENLPINGRNYIQFTLLTSQAARDTTPSIGAAPTSGLNFGGQRARSNQVSIDGADAVDHSVNGIRATVSQEAVQEFQILVSNYNAEYGRAIGGVVNIVTKGGSNEVHGNVFGFLRHKSLQARNPFSVSVDPTSGALIPTKQAFTRVQAGATIGGPIKKDKTFYFFSYETTRRQETGFTNIGANNFGLLPEQISPLPAPLLLTKDQKNFLESACPPPVSLFTCPLAPYAVFAGSASSVALAGVDFGLVAAGLGVNPPFGPGPGRRFPLPIDCAQGSCDMSNLVSLPASFVPLQSLIGNYPVKEGTSLWSLRLDHIWNQRNSSFIRANVSPSLITGIQVNAQNQNFGQNAGNRTSLQQTRDLAIVGQHVTSFTNSLFNEFRFQFARRGLHYGPSQLPGGSNPAVNITGFAFFGQEPFSSEDRIERRFQWTDNLSWIKGHHTFKFGGDVNFLQLRSAKAQIFELNFGGIFNFSGIGASTFGFPSNFPSFSAVQAYGLGIPFLFFQGVGKSNRPFDTKDLGVFAQDSWRINRRLTLNYGVRYDIEWTPTFAPGTALNKAAEPLFGVQEGVPVSGKNVAPRVALAYDPWGDGKTVIRAGYGIFYDHPALALAFLSTAEDGALTTLLESLVGTPSRASLDIPSNFSVLNASSIFQGVLTGNIATSCSPAPATPNMCFGGPGNSQRFDPLFLNSFFVKQNFLSVNGGAGFPLTLLPFTIPIDRNFKYGYAQQANLTIEREFATDWKISVGYTYTHGLHLDRTRNINVTSAPLLLSNASIATLAGFDAFGTNPAAIGVPPPAGCVSLGPNPNFGSYISIGILAGLFPAGNNNCSGQSSLTAATAFVGVPAAFNFFRRSGPNPSFALLAGGSYPQLVGLAQLAHFPPGFVVGGVPVPVPWSDVNPQESSGNSIYHGFTLTVSKRFSHHVQLLSGWTYSHAIDDSTDLSTLLNPQDNNNPQLERSNSDFDIRHRWITSAVFQSPYKQSDAGFWRKFLANFTVAPVIEVSSGRPFNILLGFDSNLDFGTATNRPSVLPAGAPLPSNILPIFPPVTSPSIKGVEFIVPNRCPSPVPPAVLTPFVGCTGTLGRNAFNRPGSFTVDLRIARRIPISERWNLEIIADGFNMLNRFNAADVSPLCDPTSGSCNAGQVTAALDPRQFQFALKFNW